MEIEQNLKFESLSLKHADQIKEILEQHNLPFIQKNFELLIQKKEDLQYIVAIDEKVGEIVGFCNYFKEYKYSRGGASQFHISNTFFNKKYALNEENIYKSMVQYVQGLNKDSYKLSIQTFENKARLLENTGFNFDYQDIQKNSAFMVRKGPQVLHK